uniref:Sorting nexin/Vps5-like C-terminal domain-containing protein n=1 Tax=Gasterosteus aculeatus aculeatus TaxID=481459 RepID=A0AAQ4QWD3_GASAC
SFIRRVQKNPSEGGEELPRAVSTQALSSAGLLRMVNKAAEAVNKMTIKMNESDAWFEEKQQHFDNLDVQLRKLHASVESLVCHRKDLSISTSISIEDHTALSRALSQLAEVEEKMEQLHQDQATADFYFFSELLGDYRVRVPVPGVFDPRVRTWQKLQDSQNLLQKKRELKPNFSSTTKPRKCRRDFDQISKTIRKEVGRFEKERVKDFKSIVIKYLESLVQTQQQLIKYWDAFLPEAKAIS